MHSAKFDNEKDSANILAAIQRYTITHPVVNDSDGVMWQNLGIPCWPTLLIIGKSMLCSFVTDVNPFSVNPIPLRGIYFDSYCWYNIVST